MAQKTNFTVKKKHSDANLALISVILGAASFFNTVFTGIPAIVLGIMALKRNAGDRTQAKLGIAFGVIGCLLLIPVIWLAVHFLKTPFREQFSVSNEDRLQMVAITDALNEYRKKHGSYPKCDELKTDKQCVEWAAFEKENPGLIKYPTEFETESHAIEDRPAGTIVYATKTTCFVNTPTDPQYLNENDGTYSEAKMASYAAIVYFHNGGRSCFPTNTD